MEVSVGTRLIQAARQFNVPLASDCGGKGTCGKCMVEIISGDVSLQDLDELRILEQNNALPHHRLACRTQVLGDVKINIPIASQTYDQTILLSGRVRPLKGDIHSAVSGAVANGIAFDIGTTTIVGSLLNIETGEEICSTGMVNPQVSIGEDIITRMDYAIHTDQGGRLLASLLSEALNDLIKELCNKGGISFDKVTDIAICGNTAISHLLLQLPISPLARAPYIAGFNTFQNITGKKLGLKHIPNAGVIIMPCIKGFVGGDHVAMILACDLDQCTDTVIGIDIGTNSEIVLAKPGSNGGLFVTSCASGPAFEGAHMGDGMRAASGAIKQVQIDKDGPIVKTINNKPSIGICGSGMVDALSELLKTGFMDNRGHLQINPYILVPAGTSGSGQDILLTQKDISQIQLAKGAIYAGITTLLKKTDTLVEEVNCVYLAGAFGSYLNIQNALSIGLLPNFEKAKFIQAGNAAIAGSSLVLLSKEERDRASAIATQAHHIDLARDPGFSRLFVQAMRFNNF